MKIWLDDARPAPDGYVWCKTVTQAKIEIKYIEGAAYLGEKDTIEIIDLNPEELGRQLLKDWLKATGRDYFICIHSMNSN